MACTKGRFDGAGGESLVAAMGLQCDAGDLFLTRRLPRHGDCKTKKRENPVIRSTATAATSTCLTVSLLMATQWTLPQASSSATACRATWQRQPHRGHHPRQRRNGQRGHHRRLTSRAQRLTVRGALVHDRARSPANRPSPLPHRCATWVPPRRPRIDWDTCRVPLPRRPPLSTASTVTCRDGRKAPLHFRQTSANDGHGSAASSQDTGQGFRPPTLHPPRRGSIHQHRPPLRRRTGARSAREWQPGTTAALSPCLCAESDSSTALAHPTCVSSSAPRLFWLLNLDLLGITSGSWPQSRFRALRLGLRHLDRSGLPALR